MGRRIQIIYQVCGLIMLVLVVLRIRNGKVKELVPKVV